jgi:hypothetical protein
MNTTCHSFFTADRFFASAQNNWRTEFLYTHMHVVKDSPHPLQEAKTGTEYMQSRFTHHTIRSVQLNRYYSSNSLWENYMLNTSGDHNLLPSSMISLAPTTTTRSAIDWHGEIQNRKYRWGSLGRGICSEIGASDCGHGSCLSRWRGDDADDAVVAPAGGGVNQIGKGRSAGPLASWGVGIGS